MKMTMHIDEKILDEVMDTFGCVTKTDAVDFALRELVRKRKLREFGRTGLGLTPDELANAVLPGYDPWPCAVPNRRPPLIESPVLVDSSVFITLLKTKRDPAEELMGRVELVDLATCGMVRLEVIRGLATPRARASMESFFDVMQNVITDEKLWSEVCELGWQVTRKGFSVPAKNIIIAACARRIGAAVLTHDGHFDRIPGLHVLHSLDELR